MTLLFTAVWKSRNPSKTLEVVSAQVLLYSARQASHCDSWGQKRSFKR